MANGYIGKISAVVTANTSDLSRRLAAAGKDFDRFANRLGASVRGASDSATGSIDKIFTRYQRLERTFRSALEINLRTEKDINKIRQLVSVAEQINKPLGAAASEFEKLGLSVQGAFLPALRAAQGQVELLNRKVNETGSASARSFDIVEKSVAKTVTAIQRLGEVQRLVSSGPNANSLALAAPGVSQSLQAAAATRQQAAQLPASALADGRVARQVRNLSAVESRIAEVQARIESLQLRPKVDTVQLEAARRELDRLLAGADRIRAGIQVRIDAQKAIADATSLNARLDQLQENARFSITGTPQNLKQVEAELVRILGKFDELTEAQRQPLGAQFSRVVDAIRAGDLAAAVREFQSLADNVDLAATATERLARANKLLVIDTQGTRENELTTRQGERTDVSGRVAANARNARLREAGQIIGRDDVSVLPRQVQLVGGAVSALRGNIESLPIALRSGLLPALEDVQREFLDLASSVNPSISRVQALEDRISSLSARSRRSDLAAGLRNAFGGAGAAGVSAGLNERALQGYTAQLQVLQQALGRASGAARGPAVQAFNTLRNAIAKATEDGTIGTAAARRELQLLTQQATRAAAAASGIGVGALGRQLTRAGDIGRAGFDRFTLGLNQAVFAIDDFFSVTGGLEQRIRAVGNNITQLGFIIGGTAGLVTGLVAVLAGQGFAAYLRFADGGKTAEDRTKAINDALSRQLDIAQQLAATLDNVASSLTSGVFSESAGEAAEFADQLAEIRKRQQELRDSRLVELDPQANRSRAEQNRIDRELQSEEDAGRRAALLIQRRRAEEEERARIAAVRASPVPTVAGTLTEVSLSGLTAEVQRGLRNQLLGAVGSGADRRQSLLAQIGATQQTQRLLADRATARSAVLGLDDADARSSQEAIARLNAQEARLRDALAASLDTATIGILQAGRKSAERIESLQEAATAGIEAGVDGALALQRQADALGASLRRAIQAISAADEISDPIERDAASRSAQQQFDAVQRAVDAQREQRTAIEAVTAALRGLDDALKTISSQAEQNLRSAESDFANARDAAAFAPAGLPRRRAAGEFAAAQEDLLRQRQSREDVERAVAAARAQAAAGVGGDREAAGLASRIAEIDQILRLQIVSAADQRRLQQERAVLGAQMENRQAAFVDADAGVQDAIRRDAVVRQEAESARRGRELARTDASRAADELIGNVDDVFEAFNRRQIDQRQLADTVARLQEDAFRQQAPAIFDLNEAVQNAILQGPSRAALEATDVSTVEGNRELNRLIRGDDAGRDQNLVELQKQTVALDELVRLIREGNVPVAN